MCHYCQRFFDDFRVVLRGIHGNHGRIAAANAGAVAETGFESALMEYQAMTAVWETWLDSKFATHR